MKRLSLFILLTALCGSLSAQELPKYYFDIQEVLISPFLMSKDTTGSYLDFRVLAISEEGHYYLVIEKIYRKGIEGREKSLADQYRLRSEDFNLYVMDYIELLSWESKFKFLIRINRKDNYEIDFSKYESDKIKVTKMK